MVTENYRGSCEGFRVSGVERIRRERGKFNEHSTHSSGFGTAIVPKNDLERYIQNYSIETRNPTVLHIPIEYLDEYLVKVSKQFDCIDIVEVRCESRVKTVKV